MGGSPTPDLWSMSFISVNHYRIKKTKKYIKCLGRTHGDRLSGCLVWGKDELSSKQPSFPKSQLCFVKFVAHVMVFEGRRDVVF